MDTPPQDGIGSTASLAARGDAVVKEAMFQEVVARLARADGSCGGGPDRATGPQDGAGVAGEGAEAAAGGTAAALHPRSLCGVARLSRRLQRVEVLPAADQRTVLKRVDALHETHLRTAARARPAPPGRLSMKAQPRRAGPPCRGRAEARLRSRELEFPVRARTRGCPQLGF